MKKLLMKLGVVAALLAAPVAYAAGLFPNFPIVGGAAYCAVYQGDGVTCAMQVPAGPSALVGTETTVFDTGLSQGRAPQSVNVTPNTLANWEQAKATVTVASNAMTPNLGASRVIASTLVPTGVGQGITINAPSNPVNGQRWQLELIQDATGTRTVSWNSIYKWPSGTAPTLTTTAGRADIFDCTYDGTDHFCSTKGLNYTP